MRNGPVVLNETDLLGSDVLDTQLSLTISSEKWIESFAVGLGYEKTSRAANRYPSEEVDRTLSLKRPLTDGSDSDNDHAPEVQGSRNKEVVKDKRRKL